MHKRVYVCCVYLLYWIKYEYLIIQAKKLNIGIPRSPSVNVPSHILLPPQQSLTVLNFVNPFPCFFMVFTT